MDVHGNCVRAEDPADSRTNARRISVGSDVSFSSTDEESYATAEAEASLQRQSNSRAGGSGLGIRGDNGRRASAPPMGSLSTITAAAAAQGVNNWPGNALSHMNIRVESRELDALDAELRRRSQHLPRESRWTVAGDHEAISELTSFLRNVTPPPSNFMSLPSPTSTSLSPRSSIHRRKSGAKKGVLMRVVRLFKRASAKKVPARPKSRSRKRPASPPALARSHAVRKKRPPRIKLPDTAVAGRTVDGHRHIAISIPIEHAHLGPESRYAWPSPMGHTRSRSMSSADTPSPRVYNDINYNVRPLTAFVPETHIGTQLGPLVEERESLSSRSWERGSSNGSGQGEAAIARKVRLASRNTFGTVHEEQNRLSSNTASGMPPAQAGTPRTSDESGGPRTPRTSDELRVKARRQALAALADGRPPNRPATATAVGGGAGASQRPLSAHSLRSFAAASSPSRVLYPVRQSSKHPSGVAAETRRPRTMSNNTGGTNNSRDSSRDQTLQESIFSDRSYLESLDTVSTGNLKDEAYQSPILVSEATFARRFDGSDVVECEPRSSVDSQRRKSRENRQSGSSQFSANSRGKRSPGRSRAKTSDKSKPRESYEGPVVVTPDNRHSGASIDKGKQRESYEGPVVVKPENSHSGGSDDTEKQKEPVEGPIVVRPDKRHSGGSTTSASAILGQRKGEPAPVVVTREVAAAVTPEPKQQAGEMANQSTPTTPTTMGRRSKFVEDLAEAPLPENKCEDTPLREGGDQKQAQTNFEDKGKGKEVEAREREPPSIELQQASPTEADTAPNFRNGPSERKSSSVGRMDEPKPQPPVEGALAVPRERSRSRGQRKDKGKQREASPVQPVEEIKRPSTPEGQSTEAKNTSPIPSPKERRDRRKSILLSRKERVAELKAALDKPGSKPSDLLWERRLSISSTSSGGSTTPRAGRLHKKRDSFPYAPTALSPIVPRTPPKQLSFTSVLTVADVQPSSPPDLDPLARKDSNALSVSSPATVATFVKTSPIPLYRSIGSVTPPESPTDLPTLSPESQFSTGDAQGTPFRRASSPPIKSRITRRRSGRSSPTSFSGRRSPVITQEGSPPRPKTAGKGVLASKKTFFERHAATPQSSMEQDASMAGPSTGHGKSILKMSRSEIFDRYEALREKQTRDMERRIRRLEANGDYWLSSMLPIMNDMSQTLKLAVGGHGPADTSKGKEVGDRTPARYDDGMQRRSEDRGSDAADPAPRRRHHHGRHARTRSNDFLDRDEYIVRHSPYSSHLDMPPSRPRLYLHDDATLGPARHYSLDRPSTSEGRSFTMGNIARGSHPSRVTSLATGDPQQYSGSTTMVDSATARASSFARPTSKRASSSTKMSEDPIAEADRLARLERISEQIDAEIRRLPKVSTSPSTARRSCASGERGGPGRRRLNLSDESDSEESLHTYQGTDADMSIMEEHWARQRGGHGSRHGERDDRYDTIEPLMRELQMAGSRVSMESASSEDLGDHEVRKLRQGPGPRAVVGFGAFSM